MLKMFPNEKWKVIPGFDGKYLISNKGNVYSTSKCKIIKRRINRFGYYDIGLDANGCNKTIKIHRAVAEAFVQNPFNFKVVNHIDGNKSNNDFSNLEWCTYSHNSRHAVDHGLIKSSKRVICKDTGEVFPLSLIHI